MALLEETVADRTGRLVTTSLAEYVVAVNADVRDVGVLFVGEPDSMTPLGTKGVRELAITGMAAAIPNAVYHATGTRIRSLPISIENVLDPSPRGRASVRRSTRSPQKRHSTEFETGIMSLWMPFTTSVGWRMPFRSPKRVSVDLFLLPERRHLCGDDLRSGCGIEILGSLCKPLDKRTAGGLARRSAPFAPY
jgi:hypothetical protein